MAWPCITRVCCLARFWNQFDKSDLSVPLTIQNYSDIGDQEVQSVAKQVPNVPVAPRNVPPTHRAGSPRAAGEAPENRRSFRGRKEPNFAPRDDYQSPGVPFQSVTQYKQDFKPWPIPKKDNFPSVGDGGKAGEGILPGVAPVHTNPNVRGERTEKEEHGRVAQRWGERQESGTAKTSSYRQEYRAWPGVRPAQTTRRNPPTAPPYGSPGEGPASPFTSPSTKPPSLPPETSYQAAYSGGETHQYTESHQGTHSPVPHQHIHHVSSTLPVSTPLFAPGVSPAPTTFSPTPTAITPGLQQGSLTDRPDINTTKGEDLLVRTKLSPNPSAVFQSGSRIFNM